MRTCANYSHNHGDREIDRDGSLVCIRHPNCQSGRICNGNDRHNNKISTRNHKPDSTSNSQRTRARTSNGDGDSNRDCKRHRVRNPVPNSSRSSSSTPPLKYLPPAPVFLQTCLEIVVKMAF